MLRAEEQGVGKEQGVDILQVLVTEYRNALVRKHLRRIEVDRLVHRTWDCLEQERQDPTGVDIVDLVMDDVQRHDAPRRRCDRSFQGRSQRAFKVGLNITVKISKPLHQKAQARRGQGYHLSGMLQLRQERATLARLCTQEQYSAVDAYRQQQAGGIHFKQIQTSRATAERRYVGCLIRYLRHTGRMTSLEANQLQREFTRQKVSDLNVSRGHYLFGLYPPELL